jgi:prevent-host-death family protein
VRKPGRFLSQGIGGLDSPFRRLLQSVHRCTDLQTLMPKSTQNRKRLDVGSTELRQRIAYYLSRAAFEGDRVVITRQGVPTPIAVLISYEEYDRLTRKVA